MRIMHNCSAKSDSQVTSQNVCLELGHPHQPMIFDILLRDRLYFLCITGDIKKTFLWTRFNPKDRDALRLLWFENRDSRTALQYGFTRVIFGSNPYILGAKVKKYVCQYMLRAWVSLRPQINWPTAGRTVEVQKTNNQDNGRGWL